MSNKEMGRLDCAIVCDLLALYHDGVVSDTTAAAVGEHLINCKECRTEYDALCAQLPEKNEISTKGRFISMMKKKRMKQCMMTVLTAVVACLVLAGSYYFLTTVPFVEVEDVKVHRIYRYEGDKDEKFFVLWSSKCTGGTRMETDIVEENGKITHVFSIKRPIIYQQAADRDVRCSAYSATSRIIDGKTVESDCDVLNFCGAVVWSKTANSEDIIPGYVYAFEEYENANMDEFGNSDEMFWHLSVDAENIDSNENYVGVQYPDRRIVRWNLHGEVIYDSEESEKPAEETV